MLGWIISSHRSMNNYTLVTPSIILFVVICVDHTSILMNINRRYGWNVHRIDRKKTKKKTKKNKNLRFVENALRLLSN